METETSQINEFPPFRLDAGRRVLTRNGGPLLLTSKVFDTLRNRERVLSKDELLKSICPDGFIDEVNLAQNVPTLRKVLGEATLRVLPNLGTAPRPWRGFWLAVLPFRPIKPIEGKNALPLGPADAVITRLNPQSPVVRPATAVLKYAAPSVEARALGREFRNYLEGRYSEFSFTPAGLNAAVTCFSRVIDIDATYLLAYAGLAQAHSSLAHASTHQWKLEEAGREFARAQALNPNITAVRFAYAEYLSARGDDGEAALAADREAIKMNPESWMPHTIKLLDLMKQKEASQYVSPIDLARNVSASA